MPNGSVAATVETHPAPRDGEDLPSDIWFPEPVREMCIASDQYDFTLSLLILEEASPRWKQECQDDEEDPVAQPVGRRMRR